MVFVSAWLLQTEEKYWLEEEQRAVNVSVPNEF